MQNDVIYSWERLPVYQFTNQLARVVGRLLVSVPPRLHVKIHTLIGQTVIMSNAIPGAHREVVPGDRPVTVEERRAWLIIGFTACGQAGDLLADLGKSWVHVRSDVGEALKLLSKIQSHFHDTLESLDEQPATPTQNRVINPRELERVTQKH
jgi:hypothetical protein